MNCFASAVIFSFIGGFIYDFSNNLNIAVAICGAGFILTFLANVWSLRLYNKRTFEHSGKLLVSEYPLKLGGSYQIRYRRPLRLGATLNQNACLKAVLRCSEVVTYYIGTDPETVRQIILEKPLINQTVLADTQGIEFKASIEIPNNSTPSFRADHNSILWTIEVDLNQEELVSTEKTNRAVYGPDWDYISLSFPFTVDPILAS
ncbi:hypothetical protein CYANOKiyG1_46640 [Okeania sp. KiyG1]|nr:hypothetical protein CYANOKiyG1_46640 [Okeania sp. KiyG1]